MTNRLARAIWNVGRRGVRLFGGALLVAFVTTLLIVSSPIWLPLWWRRSRRRRRFLRRLAGRVYLVWHARRGWYDFVRNNVLPTLSTDVHALQDRRRGGEELGALRAAVARTDDSAAAHPYLVFVGHKRVHVFSLNAALRDIKMNARRDPAMQTRVRERLQRTVSLCRATVESSADGGA